MMQASTFPPVPGSLMSTTCGCPSTRDAMAVVACADTGAVAGEASPTHPRQLRPGIGQLPRSHLAVPSRPCVQPIDALRLLW